MEARLVPWQIVLHNRHFYLFLNNGVSYDLGYICNTKRTSVPFRGGPVALWLPSELQHYFFDVSMFLAEIRSYGQFIIGNGGPYVGGASRRAFS
jgi:hypothetical protein